MGIKLAIKAGQSAVRTAARKIRHVNEKFAGPTNFFARVGTAACARVVVRARVHVCVCM